MPATVLIIGQQFDPHVDWVVAGFRSAGVDCVRWPTSLFPARSFIRYGFSASGLSGAIDIDSRNLDLSAIRSVWYRHTEGFSVDRKLSSDEQQFAERENGSAFWGLLRLGEWFWVNHPDKVSVASSKPFQLQVARDVGFEIPRTLITNDPTALRGFFDECDGAIIYKPFNSSFGLERGKGYFTSAVTEQHLRKAHLIRKSAGIFQELLSKRFDLRVTVIGSRVFATEIHSQGSARARHDWRAVGDINSLDHRRHNLPDSLQHSCLQLLASFGLAYGAIDMVVTKEGRYVFLENNPMGQFGWIEAQTGYPLTAALTEMLVAGRFI